MLGIPPRNAQRRTTPLTDERLLSMRGRNQIALTFEERVRQQRLRNERKGKP